MSCHRSTRAPDDACGLQFFFFSFCVLVTGCVPRERVPGGLPASVVRIARVRAGGIEMCRGAEKGRPLLNEGGLF